MKKLSILLIVFVTIIFTTNAQQKTLSNLTKYDSKNFGSLTDRNNQVTGYYHFYEGQKLKKKQVEYLLEILDDNLNRVVLKKIIESKYAQLKDVAFNQQQLLVNFWDKKSKQYRLKGFDLDGEQVTSFNIQVTNRDMDAAAVMGKQNMHSQLFSIDNKGFVFMRFNKQKKMGYHIHFIPTDGSEMWDITTPAKDKFNRFASFANVNEKAIALYIFKQKSMLSKRQLEFKVLNTNDGSTILDTDNQENTTPTLPTNVYFEEDGFVNIGEYFSADENPIKDVSNGMYFDRYDYNGNLITSKQVSWDNQLLGKFKTSDDKKNRNHLFFHDVIRTNSGEYYAIAEQYRRSASATGIALNALAIAAGATGGSGRTSFSGNTKLTITNSEFLHFDKDFNLFDITEFPKGKTRAACLSDFGSAPINAHIVNQIGGFDYNYTQKDPEKDRFFATFIYKEIIKGEQDKYVLKSVNYSDGNLSEDKIYLESKKTATSVYPAKAGYVLLSEYNKKEKTLTLHLEKLNI